MRLAELADARIAVWGYGREGRAALAAVHLRLGGVPVSVFCNDAEALQATADFRARLPIRVVTTPPDATTLAQFDVVIKSPGISAYRVEIVEAERAGVRFTSGSALWFAEHPEARTIAVTGTKGKSTVTALIAHILRKSGKCVALAGNIGMPLLELLEPAREPDWWAIELSSFQTCDFDGAPTIALINNLYDEHLDWHGSRERYVADKLAIADKAKCLLVNAAQPELLARTAEHPQRILFAHVAGWHVQGDAIFRGNERVLALDRIPLPGLHNAQNVCAALAALEECSRGWLLLDSGNRGSSQQIVALASHVTTFKALPHRLQSLGTRNGVTYVNDSISTTPYATIEALRSLSDRAVCVLVGGFDRGVDWAIFVDYATSHPPHAIVTMGANGSSIAQALRRIDRTGFKLESAGSLAEAMQRAQELAQPDGTILLSPGAPSFDQFHDYAERGRQFARLGGFDPLAIAQIQGLGIE